MNDSESSLQKNWAENGGILNAVQNGTQNNYHYMEPQATDLFTSWECSLRRTPQSITLAAGQDLFLPRKSVLANLISTINQSPTGSVITIQGEPGIGKSAMLIRAADALREQATFVVVAELSEMHRSAGRLKSLFHDSVAPENCHEKNYQRRVVLIDGAESTQEGMSGTCAELLESSLSAGYLTVLVCREDAAENVHRLAERFSSSPVVEFNFPALTDSDIQEVLSSAPELSRLARNGRSRWLLRRLILIDLLLHSARLGADLPKSLASESDVYIHVWVSLVLSNRNQVNGVSPDDRGLTLVSIAEAQLTRRRATFLPGMAVSSLRSDGLLASIGGNTAVSGEEHRFAHDVLRDFATARRLLLDDGVPLLELNGPRWAVRAARIMCQIRLWQGGSATFETRWHEVTAQFSRLASTHGPRWEEVPWEAVLSADWCRDALDALTNLLLEEPTLIHKLLRCANLRFSENGLADPLITDPVIRWLVQHASVLTDSTISAGSELLLSWLRSVARAECLEADISEHRMTRVLLRKSLLKSAPTFFSSSRFEALALLGADGDGDIEAVLRGLAGKHPGDLMYVVDRVDPARSLARFNPGLLVDLALAYYLPQSFSSPEQSDGRRRWTARSHEFLGFPEGSRAAWHRGPFYWLLEADPARGAVLVRTLIDCVIQSEQILPDGGTKLGVSGDFLGLGQQTYSGRASSWAWYQGGPSGPQPCMSALMAVEAWVVPAARGGPEAMCATAIWVLQAIGTAAGAGLAYSLLARHLEGVTDELDGFLASPGVWAAELSRTTHQNLRKGDSSALPGGHLTMTPGQVAMSLVIRAGRDKNTEALERLRLVANRLRAAAPNSLATQNHADHLDWKRYTVGRKDGQWIVGVRPSPSIAEEIADQRRRLQLTSERYRLLSKYALQQRLWRGHSAPEAHEAHRLAADIATARSFVDHDAPEAAQEFDGVYAVAAAAVRAAGSGTQLAVEDLHWALDLMTPLFASDSKPPKDSVDVSLPWEQRRTAALALPYALLLMSPPYEVLPPGTERTQRVQAAFLSCLIHPVHEIRECANAALRHVWMSPCSSELALCHHAFAWDAVEPGAHLMVQRTRSTQRPHALHKNERASIQAPDDLARVKSMRASLRITLLAVLDASSTRHCQVARARQLQGPLLRAYAHAATVGAEPNGEEHHNEHSRLADSLLRTAEFQPGLLAEFIESISRSPGELALLIRNLKTTATYNLDLVPTLSSVWPHIVESALTQPLFTSDNAFRRLHYKRLMAELIPNPTPVPEDLVIDETLSKVKGKWLKIASVSETFELWANSARTADSATNNLLGFLKAQPDHLQLDPGLAWTRQLVLDGSQVATPPSHILVEWLRRIHPRLTEVTRPHYQAIVDGLALSQHPGAQELQQLDE